MEKNRTLFDYIGRVLTTFGGTIVIMNLFCVVFGEGAKDYSSMFSLGSNGLSVSTTLQFLLVSIISVVLRFVCFSDKIIKQLSVAFRMILVFVSVFATIVVFIFIFNWFPIDQWQPWVGFLICFGVSVGISTVVAITREKMENSKMDEALKRFKQEKNENE